MARHYMDVQRRAPVRTLFRVAALTLFSGVCFSQSSPVIRSVVNSADFSEGLVESSLATVTGESLSTETAASTSGLPPLTLANTSILICQSKPPKDVSAAAPPGGCSMAPLLFVSPNQINFEVPRLSVTLRSRTLWVVVLSGNGMDADAARGDPFHTFTAPAHPAVFMLTDASGGVVTLLDPLRTGKNYTVWLTGSDARNTPPAQVDVYVEWAGQSYPASTMQGMSRPSPAGVQQLVFVTPPLFDATLPCEDRKVDVLVRITQTVSGKMFSSKPVSAPLLVKAGDIPCGEN